MFLAGRRHTMLRPAVVSDHVNPRNTSPIPPVRIRRRKIGNSRRARRAKPQWDECGSAGVLMG